MNKEQALEYINSATWSQWKLGLERTFELLSKVGDPQKKLRFVHVAGTNGKGSTCAMLESVLRAAGYRTGMYPSPFIEDFTERIQVDAVPISDEALCELTETVKAAADTMEDHPSQFEIITAIGMLYFAQMKCDVVVLEVGLGGRFDSTNVIDAPDVCVITNIGYDHTEYLGTTLAEIAGNKAGIIKRGADVVAYPNVPEVMDVFSGVCAEKGCSLTVADFDRINITSADLTAQHLIWEKTAAENGAGNLSDTAGYADEYAGHEEENCLKIDLPLVGEYQVRNAAVVLTAVEVLRKRGWIIPDDAVQRGMASVKWPARFEVLGTDPLFILDGGHNLQCAEAVAASISKYLPDTQVTLLIGILKDKDYVAVLDTLLPYADKCVCITPPSDRALNGFELAGIIGGRGVYAEYYASIQDAVKECKAGSEPVIAFGSLYMAGEVRKAYRAV